MENHPTLSELERAILCYTSSSLKGGMQEWQAIKWLWDRLSWSARLVTHFGASGATWWKDRYILPILCEESVPYFQKFLRGEWIRFEEESLRHCFHFFSPYASKNPSLFPPEISHFLSGVCPSFNSAREAFQNKLSNKGVFKSCSWMRDESFARYLARLQSLIERLPSRKIFPRVEKEAKPVQPIAEVVREETRERAKKLADQMAQLREEIAQISERVGQAFAKSFPLRHEAEKEMKELQEVKEALLTLLLEVDSALILFPDRFARCTSDTDACSVLSEGDRDQKKFQRRVSELRMQAESEIAVFENLKAMVMQQLHDLARLVDHVPMLESIHPFRMSQMRLVRGAREKVKRFRSSLSKGPGPETSLSELEIEVSDLVGLARALFDEGRDIAIMKEHLHGFEHRIQQRVSELASPLSPLSVALQELLEDVIDFKNSLEVASDRKHRFEHIFQAIQELEAKKT